MIYVYKYIKSNERFIPYSSVIDIHPEQPHHHLKKNPETSRLVLTLTHKANTHREKNKRRNPVLFHTVMAVR